MNQQSWLLKAVATEIRLTAINRQRSHLQRLLRLLLEDSPSVLFEGELKMPGALLSKFIGQYDTLRIGCSKSAYCTILAAHLCVKFA